MALHDDVRCAAFFKTSRSSTLPMLVYRQSRVQETKSKIIWNPTYFSEILKTLKSSYDALDGLYGADRHRVVEAVLNNSFSKGHVQAKKNVAQIVTSQNVQKSISRPYVEMISTQFRCTKTSKIN